MASLLLSRVESFDSFPRLPQELRNRIWKLVALEPRSLTIRYVHTGLLDTQYFISSSMPAILSTCGESRSEALAFFTKSFSAETSQRYIWINFNTDAIQIDDCNLPIVSLEDRARMQWLTVEVDDIEAFVGMYYSGSYENMKELKQLTLLSTPEVSLWSHWIATIRGDFEQWFGGMEGWKSPGDHDHGKRHGFRNEYPELSIVKRERKMARLVESTSG